jgi:hypothetical protein
MNRSNSTPMNKKVPTAGKVPTASKVPTANKMPSKSSVISTIAALGIACSSIASANLKFIEVPEQQLAEIRGKFIARDQVRYFKLEMTTQWSGHSSLNDGIFDHNAGLSLTFDISDRDNPTASVTLSGSLGDRDDNSPTIKNPIPATDNIEGISQTIQVEGHGNKIVNNLSIDALELRSDKSAAAGQNIGADQVTTGNLLAGSTHSYTSASDITTQFKVGDNNIGYAIKTPNNDVVIQKLAHSTVLDAGQLAQTVAISNNFQHIVNNVRVQVAFDSLQTTRTSALAIASQSLIGLR